MNQTVWPTGTRRNGNEEIEIDGVPLTTLAEDHGTPLYVFSERKLRDNCRAFRRSFTDLWSRTRVVYAGKAGINGALLRIIQEEGLSLDVVSGGELAMALAAGFNPEEISFHGNNKGPEELREALEAGVGKVVIDNLDEVGRLADLAAALGKPAQILLRLNPGVDVHTHRKISTGIVDSKFGFPIRNGQAAEAVTRILARPELDLLGYHAHIGS
ncbi:MAG: diaminopimelate decarboxylase, partial [Chloroflexota bacterium]|nr:diaminopimelate decarboxylase [Chloroflexota bacterium]